MAEGFGRKFVVTGGVLILEISKPQKKLTPLIAALPKNSTANSRDLPK
jgi:hypothetical protein